MSFPSPFTNPEFYSTVRIGGLLISQADLVEVDGIKIEGEWSEQKPTGSSGATNVWKGLKPPGPSKLTFEAVDDDGFQELRMLWDLMQPKAGGGANGTGNSASPGSAASKQVADPAAAAEAQANYGAAVEAASAAKASGNEAAYNQAIADGKAAQQARAAAGAAGGSGGEIPGITAPGASTAAAAPNPGPKPPTLSIKNGYLNYIGMTAISMKSWEGPKVTPTNSYHVVLEVVAQKDPTAAAVGAAAPQAADNPGYAAGVVGSGAATADPASSARDANAAAASAGAT